MCLWHPHIKLTHEPRLWATVVTVQDCLLCLDPIGGTFSVFPANLYVQVWFKAAKLHSLKKSLSENVDFLHTPCPPELPDMELEWLLWEIWRNEGKSAAKTHCALDPRSSQASIMKQVSCGNVSGKNPKFHLCSKISFPNVTSRLRYLWCVLPKLQLCKKQPRMLEGPLPATGIAWRCTAWEKHNCKMKLNSTNDTHCYPWTSIKW